MSILFSVVETGPVGSGERGEPIPQRNRLHPAGEAAQQTLCERSLPLTHTHGTKTWKHGIRLCFLCNFSADEPLLCETQSRRPSVRHQTLCRGGELSQRQSLNLMTRCNSERWRSLRATRLCGSGSLWRERHPGEEQRHLQGRHPQHAQGQQARPSKMIGFNLFFSFDSDGREHWRKTSNGVTPHVTCALSDWTSSTTCLRRWAAETVRRRWGQPGANQPWALSSG